VQPSHIVTYCNVTCLPITSHLSHKCKIFKNTQLAVSKGGSQCYSVLGGDISKCCFFMPFVGFIFIDFPK
jgi:hypothetical protein